mgnify:CR=1 FL=1
MMSVFVCVHIKKGLEPERAAASERMSGGHSNSSVSKHAEHAKDGGCEASVKVPHGAPDRNTHRMMSVFVCVHIKKGLEPNAPFISVTHFI